MIRWLHDLIMCAYDFHQKTSLKLEKDVFKRTVRLQSLLHFCMEMEDLTKSFLIAVICMDAVSTASKQIEEKTYGTITQLESVRPWETILRKLRVLMLVRFRLCGDVNPVGTGINPLTVKNVSEFSTYYWIARDQLAISHDNQGKSNLHPLSLHFYVLELKSVFTCFS
jgi:putative component of toxin-antitoxin plasmid stabilization module